jgi:hypothetical protein
MPPNDDLAVLVRFVGSAGFRATSIDLPPRSGLDEAASGRSAVVSGFGPQRHNPRIAYVLAKRGRPDMSLLER